jgi:hypothetical protein
MEHGVDLDGRLTRVQLMATDLFIYEFIGFYFWADGCAAPRLCDGEVLDYEEWEMLVDMVQKFYHSVPSDWPAKQREFMYYKEWERTSPHPKPRSKKKRPMSGWVYILQAGPFYKIGKTKNVDRRVGQLATLPPFDIEIIHTIKTKDMGQLELELHEKFAEKRKRGEWFELEEGDIAWLKTL